MRVLNTKQKKLIDTWIDTVLNDGEKPCSSDDMPVELQEQIRVINDHETLWQNIDRHINDRVLEKIFQR